MTWLLLTCIALAGGPVAVVLPSDTPVEEKALKEHLESTLERKDLKVEAGEIVANPKAMATALRSRPNECTGALNAKQLEELTALKEKYDEVYVVLQTTDKPRGAMVWRLDAATKQVLKVGGQAKPLPPATPPAKLVWFTVAGERTAPTALDAARTFLGAPEPEVIETDKEGILAELGAHPFECVPEIKAESLTRVAGLAEGVEGDLVVAAILGGNPFAWRWDAEAKVLRLISLPK